MGSPNMYAQPQPISTNPFATNVNNNPFAPTTVQPINSNPFATTVSVQPATSNPFATNVNGGNPFGGQPTYAQPTYGAQPVSTNPFATNTQVQYSPAPNPFQPTVNTYGTTTANPFAVNK